MINRFAILIKSIALLFCISTTDLNAQFLNDTSAVNLIKKGIDYIYNFQFKNANEILDKVRQEYPEHPVGYLLKGMITYWENYPLLANSPASSNFEENLHNCIQISEAEHNTTYEADYLLANLCARGLLLLFYTDNNLDMEVFPLATSSYKYIRRAFDFAPVYPDFCYFTGLYDYYREAYPVAHPVYKPLAILFPAGNKAKGLKELQKAAQSSVVLRAESLSFLSYIFLSYENNYQQATYYNQALFKLYPDNIQYEEEFIKNLLLIKQYDEAEKLIHSSGSKTKNSYYAAQLTIFNGILKEKKYHDYNQARELYIKGIKEISLFGDFGNEFAAYAYFGLSRISYINGDKHYKKLYRRKANDIADLKKVNFD